MPRDKYIDQAIEQITDDLLTDPEAFAEWLANADFDAQTIMNACWIGCSGEENAFAQQLIEKQWHRHCAETAASDDRINEIADELRSGSADDWYESRRDAELCA